MKIRTVLACFAIIVACATEILAQAPRQIAGFALGGDIADYSDRLRMDSELPIRYAEYLKEVEIGDIPGFKSGLVVYGDCASPGRIARIKLKYADSSEKFYDTLLEKLKKRFGKPQEWRGDPFHVMSAWKWSFTDEKGNRIGMILQHNTEDSTEKLGNVIKLYMYNFLEEEMECFEQKQPKESRPDRREVEKVEKAAGWDDLMPK